MPRRHISCHRLRLHAGSAKQVDRPLLIMKRISSRIHPMSAKRREATLSCRRRLFPLHGPRDTSGATRDVAGRMLRRARCLWGREDGGACTCRHSCAFGIPAECVTPSASALVPATTSDNRRLTAHQEASHKKCHRDRMSHHKGHDKGDEAIHPTPQPCGGEGEPDVAKEEQQDRRKLDV